MVRLVVPSVLVLAALGVISTAASQANIGRGLGPQGAEPSRIGLTTPSWQEHRNLKATTSSPGATAPGYTNAPTTTTSTTPSSSPAPTQTTAPSSSLPPGQTTAPPNPSNPAASSANPSTTTPPAQTTAPPNPSNPAASSANPSTTTPPAQTTAPPNPSNPAASSANPSTTTPPAQTTAPPNPSNPAASSANPSTTTPPAQTTAPPTPSSSTPQSAPPISTAPSDTSAPAPTPTDSTAEPPSPQVTTEAPLNPSDACDDAEPTSDACDDEEPSPTPSPSACDDEEPTLTPSPSACDDEEPSPTQSPSACNDEDPSPSPSPSSCDDDVPTPTPSPSACDDDEPTPTPSPSACDDGEPTPSPLPSACDDDEPIPTPSPTPTPTPTPTTSPSDSVVDPSDAPTVPPSTTSPPVTGVCAARAHDGDIAIGVDIVTDTTCINGGKGCLGTLCRYCKRRDTENLKHLVSCSSLEGPTSSPAPTVPASTPPATTTTAPSPSPTPNVCEALQTPGDLKVGIAVIRDSTCVRGGLGCSGASCRFCRATDTPKSKHLLECSLFTSTSPSPSSSTAPPTSGAPPATTAPASTCATRLSSGDKSVGILIAEDPTCASGGVGCIPKTTCRFCRDKDSIQSKHLLSCTLFGVSLATTLAPQATSSTTSSIPSVTTTTTPPASDSSCSAVLNPGDAAVGISVVSDSACAAGGLGCIGIKCRYCRTKDTDQSKHLMSCSLFAPTSQCSNVLTPGDRASGLLVAVDTTCANGGVGCIGATCRLCRNRDTAQSHHLTECTAFSTVIGAATESADASFLSASTQSQGGSSNHDGKDWHLGLAVSGCLAVAVAAMAFVFKRVSGSRDADLTTPTATSIVYRRTSVCNI